jgi:hypothetical protein
MAPLPPADRHASLGTHSDEAADPGLIPLVVGVMGHRNIPSDAIEPLTKSLRRLFRHLITPPPVPAFSFWRRKHPHGERVPTPLVLITPLAEGADRLVARVALEFGARLVVPLPLPQADYEQDFAHHATPAENERSLAEFRELISDAHTERVIELPRVPVFAGEVHHTLDDPTRRNLQYALVGAYIARQTQVMIALWDGHPPSEDKPGGTADIVAFRRTGRFAALSDALAAHLARVPEPFAVYDSPLDPPDTGAVHHIVTPRADREIASALRPFGEHLLAPVAYDHHPRQRRRYFDQLVRIEQQIHTFNRVAVDARDRIAPRVAENAEYLYPTSGETAAPEQASAEHTSVGRPVASPLRARSARPYSSLTEPLTRLRRAFALTDTLAIEYQHRTHSAFRWVFWFGFLAVVMFEVYAELYTGTRATEATRVSALAAYVLFLGLADAWYVWARARDIQNHFQDYRALAEGLRVQFYWRLVGVGQAASDYYLRKQRDELTWIRSAIRAWGLLTAPLAHADPHAADQLWVETQRRYYLERARPRDLAALARFRERGSGLIGASIFAAGAWSLFVALCGVYGFCRQWFGAEQVAIPSLATWLFVLLVPLGAVVTFATHLLFRVEDEGDDFDPRTGSPLWGIGPKAAMRGFALGVLVILALPAAGAFGVQWVQRHAPWSEWLGPWPFATAPHPWFVMALVLTALAGTLLHGYADRRAYAGHARQYRRMGEVFARAYAALGAYASRAAPPHDVRDLIVSLGKEALAEHADWVLLHRDRPLEPPRVEL